MFYHSLLSDWNHGNAHFLRGVASELIARGHEVSVYEPADAWSLQNLTKEQGDAPIKLFHSAYPTLISIRYNQTKLNLDQALENAHLVIVHEWNDPDLVSRIGRHRAESGKYRLLFHDTHHRSLTDSNMSHYDLSNYDGVLAFGAVIKDLYLSRGWIGKAWTWHEAADTRVFKHLPIDKEDSDLIWIGNWGDDERTSEIYEFLVNPVQKLGISATIHGVRYPKNAINALSDAGIAYEGWLPNFRVPEAFSRHKVTVHIPRWPYVKALPGIPTIRVFEALACGIPLISAPWDDTEGLFTPGEDFLIATNGREMQKHLESVLYDYEFATALSQHGLETIQTRHTCAHRVDELLEIYANLES
jgi:spore maturation protein CgeB